MKSQKISRCRQFMFTGLAALMLGLWSAPTAHAADKIESAAQFLPADAAFFTSSMRNREQIEAILKSRAVAKLKSLPAWKMAWEELEKNLKKNKAGYEKFMKEYNKPENQELVKVLQDMLSHEFFIYGGESCNGFVDLAKKSYSSVNIGPLMAMAQGKKGDSTELLVAALLKILADNPDLIKFPDLVIGFKLTDKKAAKAQLKRLELFAEEAVKHVEPLKGRFKRVTVAGSQYLTMTFDGGMVPWDRIPFSDFEEKPGDFKALKKKLKDLKLTISLGVREDYLLVAIGESTEHLAKFGKGDSLIQRSEFKPLMKYADQRVAAIDYVSKALRSKIGTTKKDVDGYAAFGKEALKKVKLPKEMKARMNKHIDEMAKDLKRFIPEPGAKMSFSFLTDRGMESFTYDWSENLRQDASKPLSLVNHVGGAPIFMYVDRTRYNPDAYQTFVKWVKTGNKYLDDFLVPTLDDDKKDQYKAFVKEVHPLFKRLDEAIAKKFLPALADGQNALVIDAKWKNAQWHKAMPKSSVELPLPEVAIVSGVSDKDKLVGAFAEFRAIVNDGIGKLGAVVPIPLQEIPAPETKKLNDGTMYFYKLPEFGFDKRLLPNAGVSSKVAVLSLSQEHTERLLSKTTPKFDSKPLADLNRPLASACYFDFAALVDAAVPWMEYAFEQNMKEEKPKEKPRKERKDCQDDPPNDLTTEQGIKKEVVKTARVVVQLLKVLRNVSSVTYKENDAMVTHTEVRIKDID